MKTYKILSVIILSALLIAPISAKAAEKAKTAKYETVVEKSSKWFPVCLNSNYPGVVESTIYNIVILKKYYPEADYSNYIKALNKIAEKHSDASIRYKAQLAIMYLKLNDGISIKPVPGAERHDYIFDQISNQLNNKLLVNE